MLAPLCADIEKATAARVKCNILPRRPSARCRPSTAEGWPHGPLVRHARYTPGRFALTDAPKFPFMGDTAE